MTRILIADDHAIIREGLRRVIECARDLTVAGEVTNGLEVLQWLEVHFCDVVLLDISMPFMSGLEVLKRIRGEYSGIATLVLSVFPEEAYAIRALKAGASGYLTKDSAPERLREAIRKIASGGKYVSALLAERLASEIGMLSEQAPHERLSDREFQVLRLLSSGKTVREIAESLSLRIPSVSTYRTRILAKMKMKRVAELTQYAIRNRIAD